MKKISRVFSVLLSLPLVVFSSVNSYAQELYGFDIPPVGPDIDLVAWIVRVLNWAIGFAALIAVAMLIFAGYMYITAGGDEGKIEKATKTIRNSIIGLVLCFIAGAIVQYVLRNILGQ